MARVERQELSESGLEREKNAHTPTHAHNYKCIYLVWDEEI